MASDPRAIVDALAALGLLPAGAAAPPMQALSGGVSSDIWRVDLPGGPVAAKRALPRLKVAAVWEAPVERSAYEAAWLEVAGTLVPGLSPRLVGFHPPTGVVVMEWLDPADHPVWKAQLRDGVARPATAAALGRGLGRLHAVTAGDAGLAARFANPEVFHALRLEPYLLATARAHRALAARLEGLAERVDAHRLALVHGDVSPKNVLVGPHGPVLVDAECATWADPAFDLAFCLNHLLLKCLWSPPATAGFLACFDALAAAYLAEVRWEPAAAVEARAAALLPALLLARIDGKSPVEYLDEGGRARVRAVAVALLSGREPSRLGDVRAGWEERIR